jgi:hypothetical protein
MTMRERGRGWDMVMMTMHGEGEGLGCDHHHVVRELESLGRAGSCDIGVCKEGLP